MSTMQTRLGDARNWIESHRAQALAVLILLAAIALIIGLSLSWFVGSKSLSTVGKIQTPAQLKIMGPNQTSIEPIEISYDESRGDVKNSNGTVTVRRAFCVQSDNGDPAAGGQAFELQVANTTNITGLTINVYRVTVNDPSNTSGTVVGLDGLNQPYSWSKKGAPIEFHFINSADRTSALAKELEANDPTYGSYAENPEKRPSAVSVSKVRREWARWLEWQHGQRRHELHHRVHVESGCCDRKRKDGLQRQRDRHGLPNCSRHERH